MSTDSRPLTDPALARAAEVRLVTIDELSNVRYLHSSAVRRLATSHLNEAELAAFAAFIISPAYSERVADAIQAQRLYAAMISGQLCATAGWVPANDTGATARLMAVFSSPTFARSGLARLTVEAAEHQAAAAGFRAFTVRSPVGALGFFEAVGYAVASYGVWSVGKDHTSLPVAFLRKSATAVDQRTH